MADYFSSDGIWLGNDGANNDDVRTISQENWNKMQSKNDKGEVTYNTDYKTNGSEAFSASQKDMTETSILNVYQYYNPTDLSLKKHADDDAQFKQYGGMAFNIDGKSLTIDIRIKGDVLTGTADHSNRIINNFKHEEKHYDDFKN
jgi:hypothetical protein